MCLGQLHIKAELIFVGLTPMPPFLEVPWVFFGVRLVLVTTKTKTKTTMDPMNSTTKSTFAAGEGEYSDMTVEDNVVHELRRRCLDDSGDMVALVARLREAISYEDDAREVAASMGVLPKRPPHAKYFNMCLMHAVQGFIELWKEKCPNSRPPKTIYKQFGIIEDAVGAAQRLVRCLESRG